MAEEREKASDIEEEKGDGREAMMKPWQQHASVISIPRFDYTAPSSLLHHSSSGFLITCPIKREKSATKEAISILEKYIAPYVSGFMEDPIDDKNVKKRKLCLVHGESAETVDSEPSKDADLSSDKTEGDLEQKRTLSLVKLTRSGLLLFTVPKDNFLDVVDIVSDINQSLESGALKRPLWCHRIFPIQATCILNEKEVGATVSNLVLRFVNNKRNNLPKPVKFAVGYNRKGLEETPVKDSESDSDSSNSFALLDRNKCFALVAAAVKDAVSDSVVDLKSPEISILIELLPLSGVPNGSLVAAVSVLPKDLVSTKPRLCIKSIVSGSKARNGGQQQG
ncbi:hypothetical protein Ancab_002831 [Ancistrocladus abbreviatus]